MGNSVKAGLLEFNPLRETGEKSQIHFFLPGLWRQPEFFFPLGFRRSRRSPERAKTLLPDFKSPTEETKKLARSI